MSQMLVFILLILALVVPVVGMIGLRLVGKRLPTIALNLGAGLLFTIAIVCVLFLSRSNVASLSVGHLTLLLPVTGPSSRVAANVPPPPRPAEADAAPMLDATIAPDDDGQDIPPVLITPVVTPTLAMTMTETQLSTPVLTPTITSAVTGTTSATMTMELTPTVGISPTTTTTSTTVLTTTPQSAPVLSPTLTATPALTPTASLTETQERIPGVASTPVVTPALELDTPTMPVTGTTTLTPTTTPEASPLPEDTANNTASNTYVVQPGDTFSTIAEALEVDMELLLEANDMTMEESELIQPGQELLIP